MTAAGGLFEGLVDRTLIISLPSHPRREHVARHFGEMGIAFELFDAFDGRQMDLPSLIAGGAVNAVNEQWKHLHSPGEVGCYFSHVAAMMYALGKGWGRVMICEDDAEFLYSPEATREALAAAPDDADMLYLFSAVQPGSGVRQDLGRRPVNPHWRTAYQEGNGAVCYVATAKALSYLLRNAFPMRYELDGLTKWPSSEWCDVGLASYLADPLLCGCAEGHSTIR